MNKENDMFGLGMKKTPAVEPSKPAESETKKSEEPEKEEHDA